MSDDNAKPMAGEFTKYKLSPEDHEKFYQRIKGKAYEDVKSSPVDHPTVVFLGGQPGAGKSSIAKIVEARFSGKMIKIDPDRIRELHPHAEKMMAEGELKFFKYSQPDVAPALERLTKEAREDKHNIKIEGTLSWTDISEKMDAFKKDGFNVEVKIMATNARNSVTGIYERYERDKADSLFARVASSESHRHSYDRIPEAIEYFEKGKHIDKIEIFNRSAEPIYSNKLVNGNWQKTPGAREALEDEWKRPPTEKEISQYQSTWKDTFEKMQRRGASQEDINRVAKTAVKYAPDSIKIKMEKELKEVKAAQEPVLKKKYEGPIVGMNDKEYIQSVKEAGGNAYYRHSKESLNGGKSLHVGSNVSISHLSNKTALAVQLKSTEMNTLADGMSIGRK